MSLLDYTRKNADHKRHDHSFILALVCMALALVVAIAIFKPAPVGSGAIASEVTSVGP